MKASICFTQFKDGSKDVELSGHCVKRKRVPIKEIQSTKIKCLYFKSPFGPIDPDCIRKPIYSVEVRKQKVTSKNDEAGHALEQFNDIQNQIENLQNSEIQDEQRDAFENAYFKAISDAKRLIADKNKVSIHSSSDRDSNMIPIVSEVDARGRVKLPQLNLPEFHGQYDQWLAYLSLVKLTQGDELSYPS
ncbi:hypothetical protein QE152_g22772 [Popillia japonica]|uniref:Uncharacterized protein n=1 Tax=Popillia japonica TaxID=7064 RepID=A0AAW1KHN7_POPJA